MRVLVTGASGFVGSAIVRELLSRGHNLRLALRRPDSATEFRGTASLVTIGDLSGSIDWQRHLEDIEAVVHVAGLAHQETLTDERLLFAVNAKATERLMKAAARAGVKCAVHISSVRAIAGTSEDGVIGEDHMPAPTNAYGRSKLSAERATLGSGLSGVILRPPLVHGAGVRGNLGRLARMAATPFPLPLGGLTASRSIVSDRNLASAVAHVLQVPQRGMLTALVADPRPMTVSALVTALRASIGRPPRLFELPPAAAKLFRFGPFAGAWETLSGRLELAPRTLSEIGWIPVEPSEAGLARVMKA
jgi:nucleoside-diphosphate-sugar epimerase